MGQIRKKIPGGTGVPGASTAGTYSHQVPLGLAIRNLKFRVLNADGSPKANNNFWASTTFRLIVDSTSIMARKVSTIAAIQDLRRSGEMSGTNKKIMRTLGYSTESASYGADWFTYHFAEDFRYTGGANSPASQLSLGTSDLNSIVVELDLPSDANGYRIELHGTFDPFDKPAGIIPIIRSKSVKGFGTGTEEVETTINDFPKEAPIGAILFDAGQALSEVTISVGQFTSMNVTRARAQADLMSGAYTAPLADATSATRALNTTGIAIVFDDSGDPGDWLDLRKRDSQGRPTGGTVSDFLVSLKSSATVSDFTAYYVAYAPAKVI